MLVLASRGQGVGKGLLWELNPGPLAPEARIMPLDQAADGHSAVTPRTKVIRSRVAQACSA